MILLDLLWSFHYLVLLVDLALKLQYFVLLQLKVIINYVVWAHIAWQGKVPQLFAKLQYDVSNFRNIF